MALAEAEDQNGKDAELGAPVGTGVPKSPRWRIFTLGAYIGIAFGLVQIGIPAITGLFLSKPFYLIPQPFVDTTTLTESLLPATPTGVAFDLGIVFIGFVLPFWAVIGTFSAIVLTMILNPVLHRFDILRMWQPGMDTVNTTFANNMDFWLSFNIGAGLGIAAVCVFATLRDVRRKLREVREARTETGGRRALWTPPNPDRGDYPIWVALSLYAAAAACMVTLCWFLLPRTPGVVFFLLFFAFFYNPFISYVSARLLGLSGQSVDIPYIKETAFLLSGTKGISIWLAPVPVENFSQQTQAFRVNELTGVRFWSLIKTDLVALPILFFLSLVFWGFIWHSDAIPSEVFPAAQINWELQSKNQVLIYSSTFVAPGDDPAAKSIRDTEFMKAIHPPVIATGFLGIVSLYAVLSLIGLPVMLVYGMMRGYGQFPHVLVLEVVGALLGRLYFQKRFGTRRFLRLAPVLLAGYFTGVGLIGMATIAMRLIKAAVSAAPF
jgi:hypothetical protein